MTIRSILRTGVSIFVLSLFSFHATAQWVQTGGPYGGVPCCFLSAGTDLLVGSGYAGILRSSDGGTTWRPSNVGALAVLGTTLHAGTDGNGVWKRPLAEMVTGYDGTPLPAPQQPELLQNYPNPFNGSSRIEYRITQSANVELTVYDLLGRRVATLVDEQREPGTYAASFVPDRLASGVCVSRLKAGAFQQTKRMIYARWTGGTAAGGVTLRTESGAGG